MKTYYVVHKGRIPGLYNNWNDCKKQVHDYDGAIYKKFSDETEAQQFLKAGFNRKKPHAVTIKENADKKNSDLIEEEENDDTDKIFIYTDGSCIRNKNSNPNAGYGIYIPEKYVNVAKPLLNQKITNNRAELTAILESIKYLDEADLNKKLCIFTDSQYCMYLFNGTGERYETNSYINNGETVPNVDLIKKLLIIKRKYNIILLKVRAHTGKKDKHSIGNEIADKLANEGAFDNSNLKKESNIFESSNHNYNLDEYEVDKNYEDYIKNKNNIQKNNNLSEEPDINKNIQMNELFDFDESKNISHEQKLKSKKDPKLSFWFKEIKVVNGK
jgi:ribonuclease HI